MELICDLTNTPHTGSSGVGSMFVTIKMTTSAASPAHVTRAVHSHQPARNEQPECNRQLTGAERLNTIERHHPYRPSLSMNVRFQSSNTIKAKIMCPWSCRLIS